MIRIPWPYRRTTVITTQRVLLDIPHIQQGINLCVPTCAAMALRHYGEMRTPEELKQLAAIRADPDFEGTYFADMVRGMARLGYQWHEVSYQVNVNGFTRGLSAIVASLQRKRPILVDLNVLPIGHTVLVVGYDADAKVLTILDPNIPTPGLAYFSEAEFESVWHSLTAHIRGAIFTSPRQN